MPKQHDHRRSKRFVQLTRDGSQLRAAVAYALQIERDENERFKEIGFGFGEQRSLPVEFIGGELK
jgi:hypothetical protein